MILNEVHLIPENEKHDLDVSCHCKPEVTLIPNGAQVIHKTAKRRVRWEIWSNDRVGRTSSDTDNHSYSEA